MYTKQHYTVPGTGLSLGYLQYLPANACTDPATRALPLVIFLHGSGERGDGSDSELDRVAVHGWPRYVREGTDYPFILICPQCPRDTHWGGILESMNRFLDHLLDTLPVDRARVYLTGLSMGGTGTWLWASVSASRFAALIPVCGAGVGWLSCTCLHTPIRAFHGSVDGAIDCYESIRMVNRINAQGGHADLTVYPGVGHNCWEKAYTDPTLIAWMLEQHL